MLSVCNLQDAIVPLVMPFVQENIGKNSGPEDWRCREAATFAFGSILEGPSPASLAETVRQAMGFLLAVSALAWHHHLSTNSATCTVNMSRPFWGKLLAEQDQCVVHYSVTQTVLA